MKEIYKIPHGFWSLFTSKNRYIYMESLIAIYDEYLYNDYFLTRDACISIIAEHFSNRIIDISADEEESGEDVFEPMPARILSKLIAFSWVKRVEDYSSFKTNIVIPEYSSMFIEVIKMLDQKDINDTDLYIQNIYANIYSFYHDEKAGIELLKTAMVNTTRLNRALQDLLHNMDKFFASLLEKKTYEELLHEHLYVYVEKIVNKKYSLLKTSDNFYIYKSDIKNLLKAIEEDEERLVQLRERMILSGYEREQADQTILEVLDNISQGIINMEKRINHIDMEHSKYVRATASRLEYLLNHDDNSKGNIILLLNKLGNSKDDTLYEAVSSAVRINDIGFLSQEAFYKKRGKRKKFEETVMEEKRDVVELSKADIMKMNQNHTRFTQEEIMDFVESRMKDGTYSTAETPIENDEEFELLVLAYDMSTRRNSLYKVEKDEKTNIQNGKYSYPKLIFHKR